MEPKSGMLPARDSCQMILLFTNAVASYTFDGNNGRKQSYVEKNKKTKLAFKVLSLLD